DRCLRHRRDLQPRRRPEQASRPTARRGPDGHRPRSADVSRQADDVRAARRAGINVPRIRVIVFMISGATAALGGIILAAYVNSVALTFPPGTLLLNAIAAAVIGGVSLFGGRGEVRGALLGALVIASVENGLDT